MHTTQSIVSANAAHISRAAEISTLQVRLAVLEMEDARSAVETALQHETLAQLKKAGMASCSNVDTAQVTEGRQAALTEAIQQSSVELAQLKLRLDASLA